MLTRRWFVLPLLLVLTAVAGDAAADCSACQAVPALCQDIVNCVKNCGVPKTQATACLILKTVDPAKYREATGEDPPAAGPSNTPAAKAAGSSVQVSGRLPPEVIQRIVRQNYGRIRLCYENGLRSNPKLQGRVIVRFVIGRDGRVSNVGSGGGSLPDPGVVSCVVRAFYGLEFPRPEGGIVTVTYPVMLSPGM